MLLMRTMRGLMIMKMTRQAMLPRISNQIPRMHGPEHERPCGIARKEEEVGQPPTTNPGPPLLPPTKRVPRRRGCGMMERAR